MKPQEPPQVTQTTKLSFIPPPPPPRLTMEAHQKPSATIGEVTNTTIQTISTPPAAAVTQEEETQEEEKQEEEKKETQAKEESAIQTLDELPTIGTPTKTVQKPSTDSLALQVSTPSSSSTMIDRTIYYGIPELDEEIKIPYYDSSTLIEEKINEIQSALDRKRQEAMRKDYKYK